jgi:hypothetical protein
MGQPEMQHRLSDLQKSILQWLCTDLRHRQRAGSSMGVPYPELVRAVDADKARVTTSLRHLMQKGLVMVTLPRGEWVRYVTLTDQGEAQANIFLKAGRKPGRRVYAEEFSSEEWDEIDAGRQASARQAQRRWARRQEIYRRSRRGLGLEPE